MTPRGHGMHPFRPSLAADPDSVIVLRCANCPGWKRQVRMSERAAAFARHLRSHLHNREPQRRLRLLQDANGKWRL